MVKKLLLSLLADKKSRRGVAKVLGGILIILIVLVGAVFSMMSIGTKENAAIIAYCFSLSDELPSWEGSVASSNAMRESFKTIDGCIEEIRAELQAEADRQCEESEDEDAPVVTVSISIDALWVKSVFFARYYGEPQPSRDEIKAFVKTFINGSSPDGLSEETFALAKEVYEEVNRQLYESGNNTAIANIHAWLWELIKDDTSPFAGRDFTEPIAGWRSLVTSEFGMRSNPTSSAHEQRFHGGIDIAHSLGTPIYAAQSGTVLCVMRSNSGYGNCAVIYHGGHISTLYGHCQTLLVAEGQTVTKGEVIATVGSTGNSTGPHLHFEVIEGAERVNPRSYLQ